MPFRKNIHLSLVAIILVGFYVTAILLPHIANPIPSEFTTWQSLMVSQAISETGKLFPLVNYFGEKYTPATLSLSYHVHQAVLLNILDIHAYLRFVPCATFWLYFFLMYYILRVHYSSITSALASTIFFLGSWVIVYAHPIADSFNRVMGLMALYLVILGYKNKSILCSLISVPFFVFIYSYLPTLAIFLPFALFYIISQETDFFLKNRYVNRFAIVTTFLIITVVLTLIVLQATLYRDYIAPYTSFNMLSPSEKTAQQEYFKEFWPYKGPDRTWFYYFFGQLSYGLGPIPLMGFFTVSLIFIIMLSNIILYRRKRVGMLFFNIAILVWIFSLYHLQKLDILSAPHKIMLNRFVSYFPLAFAFSSAAFLEQLNKRVALLGGLLFFLIFFIPLKNHATKSILFNGTYQSGIIDGLKYLKSKLSVPGNNTITANTNTVAIIAYTTNCRVLSEGTQGSGDLMSYKDVLKRLRAAKDIVTSPAKRLLLLKKYNITYLIELTADTPFNRLFGWGRLRPPKIGLIKIFENNDIIIYKVII